MSSVAAFLISYALGYYVLKIIRRSPLRMVDVFLVPGIGLGLSAQIVFYTLIIFNQIAPFWIIAIHLIALAAVFFYSRFMIKMQSAPVEKMKSLMVLLGGTCGLAVLMALTKPYGDWDAWGYWNYHANFIFRSGQHWLDVFEFSSWWAHHPWLLPCMVLWGWSFTGEETLYVPMGIAIVFTLSALGLLVAALKDYVHSFWAILAGVLLVSVPFYLKHGTSQYADILLAYLILTVGVLTLDLFKKPAGNTAFILGLFLGLAACSKDNGIVASILLFIFIAQALYKKGQLSFLVPVIRGASPFILSVIVMKAFEALNVSNKGYDMSWNHLTDPQRWLAIVSFIERVLFDSSWGLLWVLSTMIMVFFHKDLKDETVSFLFKFIYAFIIVYFFMYAASILDIEWLLRFSFNRLLFLLVPLAVFMMFYALGRERK